MNVALVKRLALLPVLVLLMAAAPLVDPEPLRVPPELTAKEVGETLRLTLIGRGWILGKEQAGAVDATLHVRSHSLTVHFALVDREIHMTYLDSVNLDYKVHRDGRRVIHKKYAPWMRNLSLALAQDLQRAAFAKRS